MEMAIKNLFRKFPSIRSNLGSVFPNIVYEKSKLLAAVARAVVGQVMVKGDPTLACADNVDKIAKIALGREIGGTGSTYRMYGVLRNDERFCAISEPCAGCIVISPTGFGKPNTRGHTGIFLDNHLIASNDSRTGIWSANYTLERWRNKYTKEYGIPTYFFMVL